MAGQLEKILQTAIKKVINDLGTSLNQTITYTRKVSGTYNTSTGSYSTTDTTFADLEVPIEFIISSEDDGRERREAKIFIAPNLIGDNQPTFQDEIVLTYAGSTRTAQIINIDTRVGLFTLLVRF
tara:strand:- start:341 stop:715 length:375 start_codon:yes stop_codon:yes gene_type:complete